MATISLISRIVNGVQRQVNLSTNVLWVQDIQLNNSSGYTLAGTTSGHAGSSLIGDDASYSHFTPASATIKGALSGIDSALGSISGFANQALSNLTTTSINQSLLPNADNTLNVGSSAARWATLYAVNVSAGSAALSLNGASINANSLQINNLAAGVAGTDAVNLTQVQNLVNGISWKQHAQAISTTALPSNTYSNGSSGVGATLTATANAALVVDGYTVQTGDRIVVAGEATASHNGIYVVTNTGSGSAAYILTRSADANTAAELPNAAVFVDNGTIGANTGWVQTTVGTITIGTTSLAFSKFASVTPYTFTNGLQQVGQTVSILLNGSTGLATASGGLSWLYDNATIGINGSNQAYVKNAGISATQLATGAFDQVTIVGGAGTPAAVASAPAVKFSGVAGQSFSANTTYAVRFGLTSNSETAGRLYAADITTTSFDLFWVVGFIQPTSAVSAGGAVTVITEGALTQLSSDTAFGANDPGKPIFLQSGGTQASTTPPSTTGQAVAKLGIVTSTTSFQVQIGSPFVY